MDVSRSFFTQISLLFFLRSLVCLFMTHFYLIILDDMRWKQQLNILFITADIFLLRSTYSCSLYYIYICIWIFLRFAIFCVCYFVFFSAAAVRFMVSYFQKCFETFLTISSSYVWHMLRVYLRRSLENLIFCAHKETNTNHFWRASEKWRKMSGKQL